MKLAVIGIGLIGGSMAIGLKKHYPKMRVFGLDTHAENVQTAKRLGVIETEIKSFSELREMDFVIVSTPVDVCVKILPEVLDNVGTKTLVWDVGSTKEAICQAVSSHPNRAHFLATHPIAGTEFSGASAAFDSLFKGKIQILCEVEKTNTDLLEKAKELFLSLEMDLREMDVLSHDMHIAYVSHLSHISSFMLGKTVMEKEKDEEKIFDLAGSGFESTVRLAKSNPNTWGAIFMQNRKNVVEIVEAYIKNLEQFKNLLVQENMDALHLQMKEINKIKKILNKQNERS